MGCATSSQLHPSQYEVIIPGISMENLEKHAYYNNKSVFVLKKRNTALSRTRQLINYSGHRVYICCLTNFQINVRVTLRQVKDIHFIEIPPGKNCYLGSYEFDHFQSGKHPATCEEQFDNYYIYKGSKKDLEN